MSDFDPGDGWREVPVYTKPSGSPCLIQFDESGDDVRMWLPEEPPLPTEPYTVIRVTWKPRDRAINDVFMLLQSGLWRGASNESQFEWLAKRITGFEVLAEPRAVTAKAVLTVAADFFDGAWQPGQMRVLSYDTQKALFTRIRDEFGVES